MQETWSSGTRRISSGVVGLDEITRGGLIPDRLYLLEGTPGSGKTTIGLQFLREGVARGERVLYVTLAESLDELRGAAASHGLSLDGVDVFEFSSETAAPVAGQIDYTLFHPSEVELGERLSEVFKVFEAIQPRRVVIDSLSELRLLARDSLRFRRQILSLKQFFSGRSATVLVLDDQTGDLDDRQMHSLAHGVITLTMSAVAYGSDRRRVKVTKLRGSAFSGGCHDMAIQTGGVVVFPRLIALEHGRKHRVESVSTGNTQVDALLGGGVFRGASTLLLGAAGSGKSILAGTMACAAARRGEYVAMYTLEESLSTLMARGRAVGLPYEEFVEKKLLSITQIDPAEMSAGEFAHRVRVQVDDHQARMVVIDSLNGFLHAMPGEHSILLHLHELLTYLAQRDVISVLVEAQTGLVGPNMQTPMDVSYLADTVVLHRFYEFKGEVRRAVSVLKNRLAPHENTIRDMIIGNGLEIGEPLREFRGVLTGTPFHSDDADLGPCALRLAARARATAKGAA